MQSTKSRRGVPKAFVPRKRKQKETLGSLVRSLILLIALAWGLRSLVIAPFNIPSGSMLPTLYIGDYLVVAKWPYGYSRDSFPFGFPPISGRIFGSLPKRGDVVVFRHPSENEDLIKRVIALPGDRIAMRDGRVILNGHALREEALPPYALPISANTPCRSVGSPGPLAMQMHGNAFCVMRDFRETLPGGPSYTVLDQVNGGVADNFPEVEVPAGHLFLMGDNRDDSLDSRFPEVEGGVGMVPVENLIGRALVTFWSTDGSASYFLPWTWFSALRATRIGNGYHGDAE
jgi:signal peptidase I